jgi:hypothetical protein
MRSPKSPPRLRCWPKDGAARASNVPIPGNVTAQIFWLKTRAKWRESPVELKHSGSIAKNDLSELPDAELLDIIYTLGREVGLAPVKTIEASLTSVSEPERPGPLPSGPGN